ncbi:hypothetical protein SAMN02744035_03485 [Thalassobacter stenotrophicus DSM 16310]|uniref:Uncharacterized protein n=2 Tax=Thalassobacter stenotrophicus TaxID=266809 RepID=A0ABY1IL69_9RHOB|nr:hypothetical protein SAMN02744035_03485 [Thalassobacter stenotrophicus DSM 16310]
MIDTTTAILSCGGRWSDKLADIKPTERVAAHRRVIGAGDQIAFCSLKSEISFLDKPLGEPPLFVSYYTALLHKPAWGRVSPDPGRI